MISRACGSPEKHSCVFRILIHVRFPCTIQCLHQAGILMLGADVSSTLPISRCLDIGHRGATLYPHFTKDYFGPDSTPSLYIWLISRTSGKAIRNLRTITGNHLGRSGAIASVLRESGTEKEIGYCFSTCSKTVADQNPSTQGRLVRSRVL